MNKVIFLMFCNVIIARPCHSGSSSHSKSDSDSGSSQKGMSRLKNRVKELEDQTEDISKYTMKTEKVNEGLKGAIVILQGDLNAKIARLEELRSQIHENTACCKEVTKQALATSPPSTTTTTEKPTTPYHCDSSTVDIVFLVDSSLSVGQENFQKQINFVATFVQSFDIGALKTQISVVTFSTIPNNSFNLNTFQTSADIVNAVNNITYLEGWTRTDLALNFARENSFTAASGDRDGIADVLIVITDGESSEPDLTRQEAEALHQMNLKVIVVGIGDNVNQDELGHIASDDQYVFHIENFDALDTLQDVVQKTACDGTMGQR